MTTGLTAVPAENVKVEMTAHRERLKQALHPGVTQKESGLSREELRWLSSGVCRGMAAATEVGEWWAHRILAALAVVLLLALGLGALHDRWAARASVQTVEQVMEMGR